MPGAQSQLRLHLPRFRDPALHAGGPDASVYAPSSRPSARRAAARQSRQPPRRFICLRSPVFQCTHPCRLHRPQWPEPESLLTPQNKAEYKPKQEECGSHRARGSPACKVRAGDRQQRPASRDGDTQEPTLEGGTQLLSQTDPVWGGGGREEEGPI